LKNKTQFSFDAKAMILSGVEEYGQRWILALEGLGWPMYKMVARELSSSKRFCVSAQACMGNFDYFLFLLYGQVPALPVVG